MKKSVKASKTTVRIRATKPKREVHKAKPEGLRDNIERSALWCLNLGAESLGDIAQGINTSEEEARAVLERLGSRGFAEKKSFGGYRLTESGAKQAGRIRYVGITTSFERQHAEFERTMRAEPLDFIQVDYALDNRAAGERILPLAADRGIAAMINLPFGRGRLFQAVQGRALPPWAADFDCASWAQFFLKYIVAHPAVTCAVPGMAKPEYAADNLGAARGRLPDAAMRRRMEAFIDAL